MSIFAAVGVGNRRGGGAVGIGRGLRRRAGSIGRRGQRIERIPPAAPAAGTHVVMMPAAMIDLGQFVLAHRAIAIGVDLVEYRIRDCGVGAGLVRRAGANSGLAADLAVAVSIELGEQLDAGSPACWPCAEINADIASGLKGGHPHRPPAWPARLNSFHRATRRRP